jgi:dinuclear metal center YbgI/SA1388 family protein
VEFNPTITLFAICQLETPEGFGFIRRMKSVSLKTLVQHCNRLLNIGGIEDWPGAVNGLQLENNGQVTRIAASVDATLSTARKAVEMGADLMVVHHGLFWNKTHPWTGHRYAFMRFMMDHNLAVYSAHLPLDLHDELGNNIQLCRALGVGKTKPFFHDRGSKLGQRFTKSIDRSTLVARLGNILGTPPILLAGGPERCRHIGVVTGGAGAELAIAAKEGVDTFITGEGPHWTHGLAEALGINVLYGGHYATETFGVKSLAENLSAKFQLPWSFVDHPSGL